MPPAKIHLAAGNRQFICRVIGRTGDTVTVVRTLDGGATAVERYAVNQLLGLYFPKPDALACLETQTLASAASLSNALHAAAAEYARWLPFADVKGNWAAPAGLAYARLLERAGDERSACALYAALTTNQFFPDTARAAALRRAVCDYRCGNSPSNVLRQLTAALAQADTDAERAELCYCIGVAHAARGEHTAALLSLLRNVVFYSRQGDYEARSLQAALGCYAALDQEEYFINTCNTLITRFPRTAYATCASNVLLQLQAGAGMHAAVSITLSAKEHKP